MAGLISKTQKGFFVISPIRKISPVIYATEFEAEAQSCKKIDRIFVVLVIPIFFSIYVKFDGLEAIILLCVTFLASQTSVYILMKGMNKNLIRYDRNIHGEII